MRDEVEAEGEDADAAVKWPHTLLLLLTTKMKWKKKESSKVGRRKTPTASTALVDWQNAAAAKEAVSRANS